MSFRRPPALANWLLDRLGGARQNALAGDLLEEFRGGRSAVWYWRQTLVAVAHGVGGSVRELRLYLLAISAAYAVQFAVTLTLWWKNYPPTVHGSGWVKFGVWVLVQVVYGVVAGGLTGLVNRKVFGTATVTLQHMYRAEDGAPKGRRSRLWQPAAVFRSVSQTTACARWSSRAFHWLAL